MQTTPKKSSWYIAVLLYESAGNTPDYQPLYEESFLLVNAISEEEARTKAMQRANVPNSYQNEEGIIITWSLKHLVDVSPMLQDDFSDGAELYARHFRNYSAYSSFEPLLSHEEL